jgi:hypothetical protein
MSGIYGITTNTDTEISQLFVNDKYQISDITITAGAGELSRGQILHLPTIITHGTVTGTFVAGETVTGGTSSDTATVLYVGTGYLLVKDDTGIVISEVLTGGTSGATATTSAAPAVHDEYWVLIVANGDDADCVLIEDIDATSAAVETQAVFTGKLRYADMVFNTSTKAQKQTVLKTLRDKGLIVDINLADVAATT